MHDQVLTDTARYADVVLPATTHFESPDVGVPYGSFAVNRIAAVIDRVGESRTNDELSAGLAARLGLRRRTGRGVRPRSRAAAVARAARRRADRRSSTQAPGSAVQFRDVWPDTRERPGPAGGQRTGPGHGVRPGCPQYRRARLRPAR